MTHSLVHVNVHNLSIYETDYACRLNTSPEELYRTALPRFLDLFKELNIHATFFVVAQDLIQISEARAFCVNALREGHEIANHSLSHARNFPRLTVAEQSKEISKAHELIAQTTGIAPKGFRGPNFYCDAQTLKLLSALGYRYDSSVYAGFAPLLFKGFYLKDRRSPSALLQSFGKLWDLAALSRVQAVDTGRGIMIKELPIVGLPLLRLPFNAETIFQFGERYLQLALDTLAKLRPQYVIHLFNAADLFDFQAKLGRAVAPFPAARLNLEEKTRIIRALLTRSPGRNISTMSFLDEIESRNSWVRMDSRA